MITITTSEKTIFQQETDAFVFFIEQNKPLDELQPIAERYFPVLENVLKQEEFNGSVGSSVVIPMRSEDRLRYLILLGLGPEEEGQLSIENLRRALGTAVRLAEKHRISSLALNLPPAERFNAETEYVAQHVTSIILMASYHYDKYITDEKRKILHDITFTLVIPGSNQQAYAKGVEIGQITGEAVNLARTWVDAPPSALPPAEFARHAQNIAQAHDLSITIFSEEEVNQMGMGGLAGVSAGSEQDCKLVVMEYKAPNENAPRLGIVGKGITFDSGGLSLKPPSYMETMKEDMAGAAAVLATMQAIAQLKPPLHVTAVIPLAENLPSGTATKPGDIVTFYNGKTAEVRNTDAEGRLILADALSYAVKHYKLNALVDLATLTGACAHALGPFFSGMMGKDKKLLDRVERAAHISGDRTWRLPFDDDYKASIKSPIADICNIGKPKYMAGAITAGFFLYNFVGDVPWVHLDIAGVAFDVPDMSYYRTGATGYGVRLLIELIMNW